MPPDAALLQYLPTGRPVTRLTVNSRRRSEVGEWVDGETTFFPVSVWAERVEHAAESLTKGSRVVVVLGTVKSRSWIPTDVERAGQTLTRLEVTAEVVAASLQWVTATVTKAQRSKNQGWTDAPFASEGDQDAPF